MTITKQLNITGGTAPYKINLLNINNCTCVSFVEDIYTLDADGTINVEMNFDTDLDSDCFSNCIVQANIVDDNGCSSSLNLNITDSCSTLTINGISNGSNPLTFVAQGTGGTAPYTYEWSWVDTNLESTNAYTNILNLSKVDGGIIPDTFNLCVTVTDVNGCKYTECKDVQICKPLARNTTIFSYCVGGGTTYISSKFQLTTIPCPNCAIDFTTLVFDAPTGVTVSNELNLIQITTNKEIYTGADTIVIPYTVFDCAGNMLEGTVTTILSCTLGRTVIPNECGCKIRVDTCAAVIGEVLSVDISDCIVTPDFCGDATSMDATSFTVINGPYIGGATIAYNAATNAIDYTIGATTGVDLIEFTMTTNEGIVSPVIELFVNLNCFVAPVLTDDTATTDCNSRITIDVLTNDVFTPAYDLSTFQVTASPTNGSAIISGTDIIYVPNGVFSGIDTFTYRICDTNGECAEATVSVTVTCVSACVATVTAATVNCDFTIVGQHPDTDVIDVARISIADDDTNVTAEMRFIVTNDCVGVIQDSTEDHDDVLLGLTGRFKLSQNLGTDCNPLLDGGYITSIKVYNSLTATATTLDLDPTTTTYLVGNSGTVTAADLYFLTGSETTWESALTMLIENALYWEFSGALNGTDYIMEVEALVTSQQVSFYGKHNPSTMWIGLNKNDLRIDYNTDGSTPELFKNCNLKSTILPTFTQNYSASCGDVIYEGSIAESDFIDLTSSNYNSIILTTSGAVTTSGSHSPTITCSDTVLTVNTNDCTNPVYSWAVDQVSVSIGATTQSVQADVSATYTVNVSCDDAVACVGSITII